MWLSDLFRGSTPKETATGVGASDPAKSALINKQIRALVPGQTIQGEVTGKNGNEVQIKLAPDVVISARLSKDVNLNVGKPVLFQVKNNGSSLTLQPLFTNTATDANVLKALDQAFVPVNDTTAAMGEAMMKAGLSIDKQSLLHVYREISQFPQAAPEDVVDLHRLGMPVTEENLSGVSSYKNLTYQLTGGLEQLGEEIPLTLKGLIQEGESQKGLELIKALVDMQIMDGLEGEAGTLTGRGTVTGDGTLPGAGTLTGEVYMVTAEGGNRSFLQNGDAVNLGGRDGFLPTGRAGTLLHTGEMGALLSSGDSVVRSGGMTPDILGEGLGGDGTILHMAGDREHPESLAVGDKLADMAGADAALKGAHVREDGLNRTSVIFSDTGDTLDQMTNNFLQKLTGWTEGNIETGEIFTELKQLLTAADGKTSAGAGMLHALLEDGRMGDLIKNTMLEQLALTPEAVGDKENIGKLYEHWQHQMQTLAETLEQNGLQGTTLSKTVDNLNQNLNFLNQINQMYQYVQIPLKMMDQTAHGDLYVYSNKKNLASSDGNLSALLHLDMEHLGPVDIYVSLEGAKVNTHFYLQEDSLLDFMMEHIHVLNERLQKKGYEAKCEMTIKDAPGENPIEAILSDHNQISSKPIIQQGFDVRA
jgi:hypothetical protein